MTLADIQNKIYFLTKTTSSSFTNADMLIALNNAYEHVCSLILKNDDRWEWDDLNQTDLPIATTDLVANQQDYSLATTHLTIDRVELKDAAGTWRELTQIDQQELKRGKTIALGAYQNVAGTPVQYDVLGNSVFLYPAPNYNGTASLKLYFTRGPVVFTSGQLSTGTLTPGFNSLFHDLLPYWVSYEYAVTNGLKNVQGLLAAIQMKEKAIEEFYGLRNRDNRPRMTVSTNGGGIGNQSGLIGGTWRADSNK